MTSLYFVRHAQPITAWEDDRTRPLTPQGMEDRKQVTAVLQAIPLHAVYASPYKRSYDTVAHCAESRAIPIHIDERLRERQIGDLKTARLFLQRRWEDFQFCEEGGETLGSVQQRNMAAITEILHANPDANIVVGTHGTALSTILNFYDSSFQCDDFSRFVDWLPYVVRLDFEGNRCIHKEEIFWIPRGY